MSIQLYQLNTPSTQYTGRTPEKNMPTKPLQTYSDINQNTPRDSRGIILLPSSQSNNYLPGTLLINQDIYTDTLSPVKNHSSDSMANIQENFEIVTQNYFQKCKELKIENQERLDIENKFQQLQQQNQELNEELIKQKQICKQMENFSKELENKLQIQVTPTSSHSSIENENQQNIIKQMENEMIEVQQQLEKEKLKSSIELDRLMKEFKIIFQEQKILNQKLIEENTLLQKTLRSIKNNQKISQKQSSNLLDKANLRKIVEQFYFDNNEECLLQIPTEQQLQAIQILKLISSSMNSKQQKQQGKSENQLNSKNELQDKQKQLIIEIKSQMGKFIAQKNIQEKDIINFQNESDELKRQLDQVENQIQVMEQNSKHNPKKNSNVSFENNNFY